MLAALEDSLTVYSFQQTFSFTLKCLSDYSREGFLAVGAVNWNVRGKNITCGIFRNCLNTVRVKGSGILLSDSFSEQRQQMNTIDETAQMDGTTFTVKWES